MILTGLLSGHLIKPTGGKICVMSATKRDASNYRPRQSETDDGPITAACPQPGTGHQELCYCNNNKAKHSLLNRTACHGWHRTISGSVIL